MSTLHVYGKMAENIINKNILRGFLIYIFINCLLTPSFVVDTVVAAGV